LHDYFLYHFVRSGYAPEKILYFAKLAHGGTWTEQEIRYWLKIFFIRFFGQQYKRSSMPDGPKIGSVGLSPRGDWKMPSDASNATWLEELD
jgi:NAD+ synthase (glutamine-hydrolysing)